MTAFSGGDDEEECLIHNEVTMTRRRVRDLFRKTFWRRCVRCSEIRPCPHDRLTEWEMTDGGLGQVRYCEHCGSPKFR